MSDKKRVLVIEDSSTVRARLVEILNADPDLVVVGEAGDGKRGIELCLSLRPDVVTLDMVLPELSGSSVTEYIMAYCPTPILIVSSSWNRGDLHKTYDALAAGAVDVCEKPNLGEPDVEWERRLVSQVKLVSRIRVITHPRARLGAQAGQAPPPPVKMPRGNESLPRLLAFGASTGGPGALLEVLRRLSPDFPLPILVVLHLNKRFGTLFPEWLDGQVDFDVAYARHGEGLPEGGGRVLLAPPDRHLIVHGNHVALGDGPERYSCRPSVDVLFESLAVSQGSRVIACLLTGMGKDGARGLLDLKNAGAATLAQDEASSVVFGMPREAIALGAAELVLPLTKMPEIIEDLARKERRA